MQKKILIMTLAGAGILAATGTGLYRAGVQHGMQAPGTPASSASVQPAAGDKTDPATGRKVLYWHDPMVPGPKFDQPGKSPFMDMQLVPMFADDAGDTGKVSISPRLQQNLGIRTAEVREGRLGTALHAVGSVAWNERDVALVQARSNGFVERLFVRAPLDRVRRGQPLAELYVPDWVAAQEDYLAARRMSPELGDAARQRMRLAGMTEDLIRLVESSGKVHARLTITAPASGVVSELGAREGMTVAVGTPLYRINGLSTVWVNADIPESAAGLIAPGSAVEATAQALPGMTFQGKVSALLPEIDAATRTLKARIELGNPSGKLVPGMFANISVAPGASTSALLVPSDAVIRTGTRNLVFIATGEGKFEPVEVAIGREADGQTEILKGLSAGQKVVVSGQFLVDSDASLKGTVARMGDDTAQQPAAAGHRGMGRIEKVSADSITLSHQPIPSLHWGAMTMDFRLPDGGLPAGMAAGSMVAFELRELPDGQYQVTPITPAASGAGGKK
jgi:Cu(I)/Ag(I) efflux system membrane fusion protein